MFKQSNPLRIVIFTAGPLQPVNRLFFTRLAEDPFLDVCGVIVDEFKKPRKALVQRIIRHLRMDGWKWLLYRCAALVESTEKRLALHFFDWINGGHKDEITYEALASEAGLRVYRVADIHSEESVALIRSLRPALGVIVGGRILREAVISIPEYGSLNVHKRKVPEYRGGGPIGYWELLGGESSIGVTIHYATSKVDSGDVLAETTIPIEECDTLESLQIKADIAGALLYHKAIDRFAMGFTDGVPQDMAAGRTYRSPSACAEWYFRRRLRKKAKKAMPCFTACPSWAVRVRLLAQYAVTLPLLLYRRKRLIDEQRAPVCIWFYHLVANRPINHMSLPLEQFVEQIDFLHRYYDVVSLDEAATRLRSGSNGSITAAITFDDGYKDNAWAIEYLRYFEIPASFFVSVGHVIDGSIFEHDRRRGFEGAQPLRRPDLLRLTSGGFAIESHGLYHEDFGALDPLTADHVLVESRRLIGEIAGRAPEHFSFPKGQRGKNITATTFDLALKYYRYVYSAYGGYNYPAGGRRHFLRIPNAPSVVDLAMVMSGYAGLRECLAGNAWGLKTNTLNPYD